jgi:hypothetical protein
VSPFKTRPEHPAEEWWARIFASAGLGSPPFVCEHTGWPTDPGHPAERLCPPYFNLGMLVAPAEVMHAIGAVVYDEMAAVDRVLETPFRCQLALTLAMVRLGIPWHPVAMRYNFPNDQAIASYYAADLADVRLFHYLRVARGRRDDGAHRPRPGEPRDDPASRARACRGERGPGGLSQDPVRSAGSTR